MDDSLDNIRIAVALRTARAALGWSQQEFADQLNVAKSTIARIETLEMVAKADFLTRALRLCREGGVSVDILSPVGLKLDMDSQGLRRAKLQLDDENQRRSDRKSRATKSASGGRKTSRTQDE